MIKAEKELYLPTRHYFEKQGFSVDGEVKKWHCRSSWVKENF